MSDENIYSTRDLYLAASLVSLEFDLVRVDFQIEGEKKTPVGYFCFEDSTSLKEVESKYWRGQISVEPRAFVTNLRGLKARVVDAYQSPHSDFNKEQKKSKI